MDPKQYKISKEWLEKHKITTYSELRKKLIPGVKVSIDNSLLDQLTAADKSYQEKFEYDPSNIQSRNASAIQRFQKQKESISAADRKRWEDENSDLLIDPKEEEIKRLPNQVDPPGTVQRKLKDDIVERQANEAYQRQSSSLLGRSALIRQERMKNAVTTDQMSAQEYFGSIMKNTFLDATKTFAQTFGELGDIGTSLVDPNRQEEGLSKVKYIAHNALDVLDNILNMAVWKYTPGRKPSKLADSIAPVTGKDMGIWAEHQRAVREGVLSPLFDAIDNNVDLAKAPEGYEDAGAWDAFTKYGGYTFFENAPQVISSSAGMMASTKLATYMFSKLGQGLGSVAGLLSNTVKKAAPIAETLGAEGIAAAKVARIQKYAAFGEKLGARTGYWGGITGNTVSESNMEGDEAYNQAVQQAYTQLYKEAINKGADPTQADMEAMAKAPVLARKVADNVTQGNMGLLFISNVLTGKLLDLNKAIVSGPMARKVTRTTAQKVGNLGLEMAKEGFIEELGQTGMQHYELDRLSNPTYNSMANTMAYGMLKGWSDIMEGDKDAWSSAIFGAFGSGVTGGAMKGLGRFTLGKDPRTGKLNFFVTDKAYNDPEVRKRFGVDDDTISKIFAEEGPISFKDGKWVFDESKLQGTTDQMAKDLLRFAQLKQSMKDGAYSVAHIMLNEKLGELVYDAKEKGLPEDQIKRLMLEFVKNNGIDSALFRDVLGDVHTQENLYPFLSHVESSIQKHIDAYNITKRHFDSKGADVNKAGRINTFHFVGRKLEAESLLDYFEKYRDNYRESENVDKKTHLKKVERHIKDLQEIIKITNGVVDETGMNDDSNLPAKIEHEENVNIDKKAHILFNNYVNQNGYGDIDRIYDDPVVKAELRKDPDLAEALTKAIKQRVSAVTEQAKDKRRETYEKNLKENIEKGIPDPVATTRREYVSHYSNGQNEASDQDFEQEGAEFEKDFLDKAQKKYSEKGKIALKDLPGVHDEDPEIAAVHKHLVNEALGKKWIEGSGDIEFEVTPDEKAAYEKQLAEGHSTPDNVLPGIVQQFNEKGTFQVDNAQDIIDAISRSKLFTDKEWSQILPGVQVVIPLAKVEQIQEVPPVQVVVQVPEVATPDITQALVFPMISVDLNAAESKSSEDDDSNRRKLFAVNALNKEDWEGRNSAEHEYSQFIVNTYPWTNQEHIYVELDMLVPWNHNPDKRPSKVQLYRPDGNILFQDLNVHYISYYDPKTKKMVDAATYERNKNKIQRIVIGKMFYKKQTADDLKIQKEVNAMKQDLFDTFLQRLTGLTNKTYDSHREAIEDYVKISAYNPIVVRAGNVFTPSMIVRNTLSLTEFDDITTLPALASMRWLDQKKLMFNVRIPGIPPELNKVEENAIVEEFRYNKIEPGDLVVWVSNNLPTPTYYPVKVFVPMVTEIPGVLDSVKHVLSQYVRTHPIRMQYKDKIYNAEIGVPTIATEEKHAVNNTLALFVSRKGADLDLGDEGTDAKTYVRYPQVWRESNKLFIRLPVLKLGVFKPVTKSYPLESDEKEVAATVERIIKDFALDQRRLNITQDQANSKAFMDRLLQGFIGEGNQRYGMLRTNVSEDRPFRNTVMQLGKTYIVESTPAAVKKSRKPRVKPEKKESKINPNEYAEKAEVIPIEQIPTPQTENKITTGVVPVLPIQETEQNEKELGGDSDTGLYKGQVDIQEDIDFMTGRMPVITDEADHKTRRDAFNKWFAEVFPEFGIEENDDFLRDLYSLYNLGEEAVGAMYKGTVILATGSPAEAGYHEAGHIAQHFILSDSQRAALLAEKRKKIPGSENMTDKQVFEEIMIDFGQFSDNEQTRKKGDVISEFYRRLKNFIKKFIALISGKYRGIFTLDDFNYGLYHNLLGRNIFGQRTKEVQDRINRVKDAMHKLYDPMVEFMSFRHAKNANHKRAQEHIVSNINRQWLHTVLREEFPGSSLMEVLKYRRVSIQDMYAKVHKHMIAKFQEIKNSIEEDEKQGKLEKAANKKPFMKFLSNMINELYTTTTAIIQGGPAQGFERTKVNAITVNEDSELYRELLRDLRQTHGVRLNFNAEGVLYLMDYLDRDNLEIKEIETPIEEPGDIESETDSDIGEIEEEGFDVDSNVVSAEEGDYKSNITNKTLRIEKQITHEIKSVLSRIPLVAQLDVERVELYYPDTSLDLTDQRNFLAQDITDSIPLRDMISYYKDKYGLLRFVGDLNDRTLNMLNAVSGSQSVEDMISKLKRASIERADLSYLYIVAREAMRLPKLKTALWSVARNYTMEAYATNIVNSKGKAIKVINKNNSADDIYQAILRGYFSVESASYEFPLISEDERNYWDKNYMKVSDKNSALELAEVLALDIPIPILEQALSHPQQLKKIIAQLKDLYKRITTRGNMVSLLPKVAQAIAKGLPQSYTSTWYNGSRNPVSSFKRANTIHFLFSKFKEPYITLPGSKEAIVDPFLEELARTNGYFLNSPLLEYILDTERGKFNYGEASYYTVNGESIPISDMSTDQLYLNQLSIFFADNDTRSFLFQQMLDSDVMYQYSVLPFEGYHVNHVIDPLLTNSYLKAILQEAELILAMHENPEYKSYARSAIEFTNFPFMNELVTGKTEEEVIRDLMAIKKNIAKEIKRNTGNGDIAIRTTQFIIKEFFAYMDSLIDNGLIMDASAELASIANEEYIPHKVNGEAYMRVIRIPPTGLLARIMNKKIGEVDKLRYEDKEFLITSPVLRDKQQQIVDRLFDFFTQDLYWTQQLSASTYIHPMFYDKMIKRMGAIHAPGDIGNVHNIPVEERGFPILYVEDIAVPYSDQAVAVFKDNSLVKNDPFFDYNPSTEAKSTDSNMLLTDHGTAQYMASISNIKYNEAFDDVKKGKSELPAFKPFIFTPDFSGVTGKDGYKLPAVKMHKIGTDYQGTSQTAYETLTIPQYYALVLNGEPEGKTEEEMAKEIGKISELLGKSIPFHTNLAIDMNMERPYEIYRNPVQAMYRYIIEQYQKQGYGKISAISYTSGVKAGPYSSKHGYSPMDLSKIPAETWWDTNALMEHVTQHVDTSLTIADIRDQVSTTKNLDEKNDKLVYQIRTLIPSLVNHFEGSANKPKAVKLATLMMQSLGRSISVQVERLLEQYPDYNAMLQKVITDMWNEPYTSDSLLEKLSANPTRTGTLLPIWHNQVSDSVSFRIKSLFRKALEIPGFGYLFKNTPTLEGIGRYIGDKFVPGERGNMKYKGNPALKTVFSEDGKSILYSEVRIPLVGVYKAIYKQFKGDMDAMMEFIREEKLDYIIGLRVPLEKEYSIIPQRIVGFHKDKRTNQIEIDPFWMKTGGDMDSDTWYTIMPAVSPNTEKGKPFIKVPPGIEDFMSRNNAILDGFLWFFQQPELRDSIVLQAEAVDNKYLLQPQVEDKTSLSSAVTRMTTRVNMSVGNSEIGGAARQNNVLNMIGSDPKMELPLTAENRISMYSNNVTNMYPNKTNKGRSSGLINALLVSKGVNNPKDPRLAQMGITRKSLNPFLTALSMGFDDTEVIRFINEDIFKHYVASTKKVSWNTALNYAEKYHGKESALYADIRNLIEDKALRNNVMLNSIQSGYVSIDAAIIARAVYFNNIGTERTLAMDYLRLTKEPPKTIAQMVKILNFIEKHALRKVDGKQIPFRGKRVAVYDNILPEIIVENGRTRYDWTNISNPWLRRAVEANIIYSDILKQKHPEFFKPFRDTLNLIESLNKRTVSPSGLKEIKQIYTTYALYNTLKAGEYTAIMKDPVKTLNMLEDSYNIISEYFATPYEAEDYSKQTWVEVEYNIEVAKKFNEGTYVIIRNNVGIKAYTRKPIAEKNGDNILKTHEIFTPFKGKKGIELFAKDPRHWMPGEQLSDEDIVNDHIALHALLNEKPADEKTMPLKEYLRPLLSNITKSKKSINQLHRTDFGAAIKTYTFHESARRLESNFGIDLNYRELYAYTFNANNPLLRLFATSLLFNEFHRSGFKPHKNSIFYMIDPYMFYNDFFSAQSTSGPVSWYDRAENELHTMMPESFFTLLSNIRPDLSVKQIYPNSLVYEYKVETQGNNPSLLIKVKNSNAEEDENENSEYHARYLRYEGEQDNAVRLYEHAGNGYYVLSPHQASNDFVNVAQVEHLPSSNYYMNKTIMDALNELRSSIDEIVDSGPELVVTSFKNKLIKLKPC